MWEGERLSTPSINDILWDRALAPAGAPHFCRKHPARVRLLRCVRRPFINVTGLTSLVPVYHAFDTRRRVPCIPTHRGMVSCRRENAVLSGWSRRVHADPQLQVCQCSPCDVAGKPVQVQMLIPLVSSTLALCTKQALDDELRDAEQIPAC